VIPVVCD